MFVDYTGRKWHQLKAIKFTHHNIYPRRKRGPDAINKVPFWDFMCDCGEIVNASIASVRIGGQKSCGCLRSKVSKDVNLRHGDSRPGSKYNRIYRIWSQMKRRCDLPTAVSYPNYGGRGISVCKEWSDDYVSFKNWSLENGYEDNLTIDRTNNDGNYEPDNCRWTTRTVQANNRSTNRIVEYEGKKYTLAELGRQTGTDPDSISYRLNLGYSPERAVEMELDYRAKINSLESKKK